MGDEIVPRDYYDPGRAKWSTRKKLAEMKQEEIVRQAATEAAARGSHRQVEVNEHLSYYRAELRTDNGFKLAAQTAVNAQTLNHIVTEVSQGNPWLEDELRDVERSVLTGAKIVTFQYMTRQ
jgi:hypothetical protein